MVKPTITQFCLSIAAFSTSMSGLWWIESLRDNYGSLPFHPGYGFKFALSTIATSAALSLGWVISLVALARGWQPNTLRMIFLGVMIAGFIGLIPGHGNAVIDLVNVIGNVAVLSARKFAFPELGFMQSDPPQPSLSLFPPK